MTEASKEGYLHTFRWPHSEPQGVIVTGTFDNWSSSVHLHRDDDNNWTATVPLPYGQTVLYKYVVDGDWRTHHEQPLQQDDSGNMNNAFEVPNEGIMAEVQQLIEPHSLGGAINAAGGAAAVGLGATAAAIGGVFGFGSSSSNDTASPSAAEKDLPINHVPSSETAHTSNEKPAEPAPSRAENTAQTSLPTVPSSQDLQDAVDKDPKPSSANLVALGEESDKKGPELAPLAPLAPPEANEVPTESTAVEAAGEKASEATGSKDGEGFLRLTEDKGKAVAGAAAAAVGVGAAGAAVGAGAGAGHSKEVEPVKGIEVYKADGSVGSASEIETAKAEHESHSAAGATGHQTSSTPAASTKQDNNALPPPIATTFPISSTAETKAAAASAPINEAKKKSSSPPPTASNDVFSSNDTAPKAATVSKATNKSYEGLGQKKPEGKPATVSKATGLGATGGGPTSSAPNTPNKEEVYKTAPTTPATPAEGKKGEHGRQRTSSFFSKVKMALSPSKSKK